jgi:hypothetical protein
MALKIYTDELNYLSRLLTTSTIVVRDNPAFQPAMGPHVPVCAADNLLHRVRGWIASCLSDHPTCARSVVSVKQRPTRVPEVIPEGVKLRSRTDDVPDFKHFTVNHMWGSNPSRQLRLEQSRLEDFQINIPWDDMSSICKEAVRITRHLGY